MRKSILLNVVMVMILSTLFLTTSCAKKKMQTESVSTTQPEVQKALDRTPDGKMEIGDLQNDQLQQEAAVPEVVEKKFDNENIYFEFDSSVLSDQAKQILNNKADYLRSNTNVTLTVEGHCDDRGTETYNLGLGQRRAESVKNFLVDLGISPDRLVTVSYGEKHPVAFGHDESSWAKNRRAQTVVNLLSDARKSFTN